ncbi:MAG: hypothetical protein CO029_00050 [Candidatus Magasanikbacteria bacterium CG_4_9_14_0_2_um_filter_41_10]|uniref:Uncharacterized protein n=1 Tax=Candidatus Magasanikbacteria bacterium CG_4_10_14_0_2_um_filter_41_31 TaxID=1974639 RepID=A0A2M7V523_9BACT|nr:MAG: hypothetical protein AUJ37_01725 [Candidatus Magasanikbacteria bacterium CG1_02_41_34]PIZ93694.1 MAG: hypothetical protein COX83_00985 [Candidatus Magasanikbacteria bacterium CG_4_10_14_0_2_um_filter_41_31]PJC53956.1 MAG: hypothetical protein CO029_00050 [Candidatus Magasanikbacteria bacterium CG_4_9_14_0_2_um_filter_41_10]
MHSHKFYLAILIPLAIVIGVGVFFYVQKNSLGNSTASLYVATTTEAPTDVLPNTEVSQIQKNSLASNTTGAKEHPLAVLDKQRLEDMYDIQSALEHFWDIHGAYPYIDMYLNKLGRDETACLNAIGFQPAGCTDPYMAVVPFDPGLGAYLYMSDGESYFLRFTQDGKSEQFPEGEGIYDLTTDGIIPLSYVKYVGEYGDGDGDQLPDDAEIALGWDPNNADTDGDGFSDFVEVMNGLNPNGDGELPNGEMIRQMFLQMATAQ